MQRPHIILVMADDQAGDRRGITTNSRSQTPHLDEMAEEDWLMILRWGSRVLP